jgi:hypothetical protein
LAEHGAKHNIATPYHPKKVVKLKHQRNKIKNILQKTINKMGKKWKYNLPNALLAYRIAYKMPIGMSSFQLVYGKICHLPVKLESRAHWAVNK